MEDASGEISFQIILELREENGKTILSVKPDMEWLLSEERQYPVRIDPTPVEIQKSAFTMIGVEEGSPNSQIGDNNYPYVGFDDGIKSGNLEAFGSAHQNCRTYIKVNDNFSQIPRIQKLTVRRFLSVREQLLAVGSPSLAYTEWIKAGMNLLHGRLSRRH